MFLKLVVVVVSQVYTYIKIYLYIVCNSVIYALIKVFLKTQTYYKINTLALLLYSMTVISQIK